MSNAYYSQDITPCFGKNLLNESEFAPTKAEANSILQTVLGDANSGKLPIISLCRESADLAEINDFAKHIRDNFESLVILGTGGSSLCGHALAGYAQSEFGFTKPKVHFMQNIDPVSFAKLFQNNDIKKTAFLTISKSGTSVETIFQFLSCLSCEVEPSRQFFSVCMPDNNQLREISNKLGIKTYTHDPLVGGRFSILSLVGLMPAAVLGMDIKAIRNGAKNFLENYASLAADSAAIHVAYMRRGIWQNVMMTYPDRLEDLNIWYRQIWAESIGKNGTGSTPIKSLGTIDQHSQMQLYLGGRKDKLYNFIALDFKDDNFKIKETFLEPLSYLRGKSLADLMNAEQEATIDTLAKNGRPVRTIRIGKLDEEILGMLIMHLMLETIITAHLLGVNPYDQPAVEEGKIRTKEIMRLSH